MEASSNASARSEEERKKRLELWISVEEEAYAKGKGLAEAYLDAHGSDADVARVGMACLLLEAEADPCIALRLEKFANATRSRCSFERSYASYRASKISEALRCLQDVREEEEGRGTHALRAQLQFRRKRFRDADDSLEEALKHPSRGSEPASRSAILGNVLAARVANGSASDAARAESKAKEEGMKSFEIHYNVACSRILNGDPSGARSSLEEAKRKAETLADDSAVGALMAYLDGDGSASLRHARGDECVVAIASSNAAAMGAPLEEALSSLEACFGDGNKHRPKKKVTQSTSGKEQEVLMTNRALLLWHLGHKHEALKAARVVASSENASTWALETFVSIASLIGEQAEAEKGLGKLLSQARTEDEKRDALLFQAQMELGRKQWGAALEALQAAALHGDPSWRHMPAVVATISSLVGRCTGKKAVQPIIEEAITFWEQQRSVNRKAVAYLEVLRFGLAQAAEGAGDEERALQVYKALLASKPSEHVASASTHAIVSLYCRTGNLDAAKQHAKALPSIQEAARMLDPETLELSQAFLSPSNLASQNDDAVTGGGIDVPGAAALKLTKKKRRGKKRRLPKGYDPEHPPPPPDPERWLPLRERSYYKKSKRDKIRESARGAQGSTRGESGASKSSKQSVGGAPAAPTAPKRPHGSKKGRKGRR